MSLALDLPRLETTLRLPAQDELQQLLQGLLQPSARIDSKYLYDDRGCELFTDICRLDEYYPTRTEAHIFSDHRDAIAAQLPDTPQWIDLGCGDCSKTLTWLDAVQPARVIGVDIAGEFLHSSMAAVARANPELECVGVVCALSCRSYWQSAPPTRQCSFTRAHQSATSSPATPCAF